jgi:hypothetical protein
MTNNRVRRFALYFYLISIVLVVSTLILTHVNMQHVTANRAAVRRHIEVSQAINQLYTSLLDAEASMVDTSTYIYTIVCPSIMLDDHKQVSVVIC